MKKLLFILLITSLSYAQQGYRNGYDMITLKTSIDPKMAYSEKALDIKVEVSFTTKNNNQFGMAFENFKKRDFRAMSIFYGHEFSIRKVVVTPYVEFGNIFRKHENDWSWNYYFYYGVGTKFRIPITENFGVFINNTFVRRTDLTHIWGKNAVKWRYNNYVGLFIKLN